MIPFTTVVCNIFVQHPTQRTLAKEKDLRQTFLFFGSYPAFRVRNQIALRAGKTRVLTRPVSMIARKVEENSRIWPGYRSTGQYRIADPSFSFRISPCLISVFRRPSDCFLFKRRLSSLGRIPGCVLINESIFSRSPPWRPCFVDLTDGALCLIALSARPSLFWVLVVFASSHLSSFWEHTLCLEPASKTYNPVEVAIVREVCNTISDP
jgi:hypothetical protein